MFIPVDHIWAWRADHGNPGTVGWTVNTAAHGLVVNGGNVLINSTGGATRATPPRWTSPVIPDGKRAGPSLIRLGPAR